MNLNEIHSANKVFGGLVDNLHGGFGLVDNLYMTYEGNMLTSVRDVASRLPYAGATDFDGVPGQEYPLTYNASGSLVSDAGRGIARIDYDRLNNPVRIQFTDGSVTRYIYSAAGEKLRVIHQTAVPNITVAIGSARELAPSEILSADSTDYLLGGSLTLRNGRIDKLQFEEGYCQAVEYSGNASQDNFTFHYYDRDHLGNIRQVIKATGSYKGTVIQTMDYYPFGAQFCDGSTASEVQSRKYNFSIEREKRKLVCFSEREKNRPKVNGKELDKMHGLNTYDYGARQYNPVTARWDRMDPLCEKYYSISPYAYCEGNPVRYIDSDGRKVVDSKGRNIFYLDRNGVPQISKYASSNDRMVYKGMMLAKTGQKQLKQMVRSSTRIHLEYADVCKNDEPGHITYAETFQGRKGKKSGIYKENDIYKLEDATITFYMKNIKNSIKDSDSDNYGYTMIEAMGAEATHESVHAADPDEIHKDIKSHVEGPKRSKEAYERKARKKEQDYRNELK